MTPEVCVCNGLGFSIPMSDRLLGVLLCVRVLIQAFSLTTHGDTCKNSKILFFLLLLLCFRWGLLVAVIILPSSPRCSSGAPPSGGVLCVYSSMLRCFIDVLYCGEVFMRCCSLPLCLIGCLLLPFGGVVDGVDVEVVVACVCGSARMTLSLVGPSAVGAFVFGRS